MAAKSPKSENAGGSGTASGLTVKGESEEVEEFTSSSHCSELLRRQNEQRKHGQFCDVTIAFHSRATLGTIGNSFELRAHRSVLSAATDYFSLLLGGQYSESVSGRVEMREWSSETGPDRETVESVFQFMYTGEIQVSTANVHEVLELADRFLLVHLKEFCGEFLERKLSLANCVAVQSLAHMYSLDKLALRATDLIRRNFQQVALDEEFLTLPFHLVRDWLADAEISVETEEVLLEVAVKWVQKDVVERERYFQELFGLLRLPLMRPSYLTRVVKHMPLVVNSAPCLQQVLEAVEAHALYGAGMEPWPSHQSVYQPRFGQDMDVIMVVGGMSEGEDYLSECVGYFVAEDRWVNLPHIQNYLGGHALATTATHVYVAGSTEPQFAGSVARYSPARNTWEQVSSLPTRKHSFSLTCVRDALYSIGGHSNFNPGSKDVSMYEPDQDRWLSLESAPRILHDVKAVSVEDRCVYVTARTPVDMDSKMKLQAVTMRYDTDSQQWTEVEALPLLDNYCAFQMAVVSSNFYHTASCCPRSYCGISDEEAQLKISDCVHDDLLESLPPEVMGIEGTAICYLGDDLFIVGGKNSFDVDPQYRREAYRYCALRKRWMLLPPMPQARCQATACHVRIPYRFLHGSQHYPTPQTLVLHRDRIQQEPPRRTLSLLHRLEPRMESAH